MFRNLLASKPFIGAVILFFLAVGGSLLYQQHVEHQEGEHLTRTEERIEQQSSNPTAQTPVGDTSQGGHWHGDEWHADPHEAHAADETPPSEAYQVLREKYPEQTNNPSPFENVPVDLWDFEATKKAFMENFNFYVAQGGNKPEVFESSREVRIAYANMMGIHNAAKPWVGLYTPEQRMEINALYERYSDFQGVKVNHDRVWELVHDKGYSVSEALDISSEEDSNR